MSRSDQITSWLERIDDTRRTLADGRARRRPGLLDEDPRPRAGRVESGSESLRSQPALRGTTITGGADEEFRRRLPMAGHGGAAPAASSSRPRSPSPIEGRRIGSGGNGAGGALGRARQLAAGYQPAVVKVVSYARGVARATATGQYIQREEVALETHDGRLLADREAVAEEVKAWSAGFSKRAESQDVVSVRLRLGEVPDTLEGRETFAKAVAAGFQGHRYAARIDTAPSGHLEARIVVAMAGNDRERFRVREDGAGEGTGLARLRFDRASETLIAGRMATATGQGAATIDLRPTGTSHGRDGVTYRLNGLVQKGAAIDDHGAVLANVADTRLAARDWSRSLRSQSSRDTMHLVISAKAGTDVAALTNAARAFLHDRFADHKFMFGVHTDKEADGHIHAHAVITVKNEAGQKIHPGRDTFRDWREAYAEHAQAQGLKIVATSAGERASSQSYGPRDKVIVDAADRPRATREGRDRAYAADPNNQRLIEGARHRINVARGNPIRLPTTDTARQAVSQSVSAWNAVAQEQSNSATAQSMLARLSMAQAVGAILHRIGTRVGHLTEEHGDMAITSEKMVMDLRAMNDTVSRTSELLEGQTKQQFQEASARYLETLANRIDLQRAQERGIETITRAEVEAIAGPNADRLIARAQQIQDQEAREAAASERLVARSVEAERRQEGRAGDSPEAARALRVERGVVSGAEQAAGLEDRQAAAASEAARRLTAHPGQPLPENLAQTDALAKLRAEQERMVEELEADRVEAEATKPQRIS